MVEGVQVWLAHSPSCDISRRPCQRSEASRSTRRCGSPSCCAPEMGPPPSRRPAGAPRPGRPRDAERRGSLRSSSRGFPPRIAHLLRCSLRCGVIGFEKASGSIVFSGHVGHGRRGRVIGPPSLWKLGVCPGQGPGGAKVRFSPDVRHRCPSPLLAVATPGGAVIPLVAEVLGLEIGLSSPRTT